MSEIDHMTGLTIKIENLPGDAEYRVYFEGKTEEPLSMMGINELRKMFNVPMEETYFDGFNDEHKVMGYLRIPYGPIGDND